MEKIIALCISLVLTIGLISYGLFSVNRQYSDVSDNIGSDAATLSARINDGSIVSKDEALRYFNNMDKLGYRVKYKSNNVNFTVSPNTNTDYNIYCKDKVSKDLESLSQKALFKLNKRMGDDGKVSIVELSLIDQSN